MPFPISYRGEMVCNPSSGVAALLRSMAEEFQSAGLQNVYVWSESVSFGAARAQPFSRWNTLTVIDGGEVKISRRDDRLVVSYSLRFKGILIGATIFLLFSYWMLGLKGDGYSSSSALPLALIVAFFSLVMVVGNFLPGVSNFASLMRRALKGV